MNELQPLLAETDDSRLRALLEAGQADTPPEAFQRRLMLSVGVGVAAAGGVSSAAAASGGQSALTPAAAAVKASGAGSLAIVSKWVLVGVCCGGAVAGASQLLSESSSPSAPGAKGAATALVSSRSLPKNSSFSAAPPAPPLAPREPPEPVAVRPPTSSTDVKVGPSPSGRLASEVRAIDAARRALAEGRFRAALLALDAYDRLAMPRVLAREAQVLRIEALYRAGERELARAMAERYSDEHPRDAHAARLRALISLGEAQ